MRVIALRCFKPVDLADLKGFKEIQAIDSTNIYGLEHVEFALEAAKKSFQRKEALCTDFFVEALTRASGQRQIKKAIDMFGLKGSTEIVVFGENIPSGLITALKGVEHDIILDRSRLERLKVAFSISDEELNAVSDNVFEAVKELINERIALISSL